MVFNVIKETIDNYLIVLAGEDERLGQLLRLALSRPLCKTLTRQDRPDHLLPLQSSATADTSAWLRNAFDAGQAVYAFAPDPRMQEDLRHIADWIGAAIINDAPWLKECDEQGRPKKLLKIGSLERATREANKAMLLLSQKAAAMPYNESEGERTVMSFAGGYRIVQLLTPAALDRESAYLGHCIGNGGYDAALLSGKEVFYSLRDPQGKGHATMQVNVADNALLQCKGKQNAPPVSKYMPPIQAFVKREQFKLIEAPRMTGLIEKDGLYHDICNLPAGLSVGGSLFLRGTAITALPKGLSVGRDLFLRGTAITALPKGLSVGRDLFLHGTAITALPEELRVGGRIWLPDGTACNSLDEARSRLGQTNPATLSFSRTFHVLRTALRLN